MSKLLHSIPKKLISIYLLWISFHLVLLLLSGGSRRKIYQKVNVLVPFDYTNGFRIKEYYDYSEFLIYTILPVLIILAIFFFFKKTKP